MDIGMLWYDDSSRSLKEKVQRAVEFYTQKYGRTPTLCLINPASLNGGERESTPVPIRAARSVMPNHLWIGVDEEVERSRGRAAQAGPERPRRKKAA